MWIADIGSGGDPFPPANLLVERYLADEGQQDRNVPFLRDGKLVVVADVQHLPFRDKAFDFVWCSHVLEHVEDPVLAVQELFRVSDRGIVFVPNPNCEALFQQFKPDTSNGHKWLCWSWGFDLFFLRCDTADKEQTKNLLASLNCWPPQGAGNWGCEHRMGWGWGTWPERFGVTLYQAVPKETQTA